MRAQSWWVIVIFFYGEVSLLFELIEVCGKLKLIFHFSILGRARLRLSAEREEVRSEKKTRRRSGYFRNVFS